MTSVKVLTWNVRGMNTMKKRYGIQAYVKRRGSQVVMLQETHLLREEGAAIQKRWRGRVYHTSYSAFSRGVLTCIRPGVPFPEHRVLIDDAGRYIIVCGKLHGRDVALINVYAPNTDQQMFLDKLSGLLMSLTEYPMIVGGDFNCIPNVTIDRSHPPLPKSPVHRMAKCMREWENRWQLLDTWRIHHPDMRDYSFFSGMHELYVRLDRVYCSSSILVVNSEYLPRTCSNHNPLIITLHFLKVRDPIPSWSLRKEMLEDRGFRAQLQLEAENYFTNNWGSTESRLTEWEAFKVVVRGCCISNSAGIRPTLLREVQQHEEAIRSLEMMVPTDPTKRAQLTTERGRWAEATERLGKFDYKAYLVRAHDEQDKAGRMMAWLINPDKKGTMIVEINDAGGKRVQTQQEINTVFAAYYRNLYASPSPLEPIELNDFLESLSLRSVQPEVATEIGRPMTEPELRAALKHMARGKVAGIDGLPAEFYVTFSDLLLPRLVELYGSAWKNDGLPPSLTTALMVALPKKDRDRTDPASFQPLSMLSTDYKLLSGVLAARLLPHVSKIIHHDQSGFIPRRNTAANIRRLMSVMEGVGD